MITFSHLGRQEWGRLGNQLFQIAATLGIADLNGQIAVFPHWEYNDYFIHPLPEGCLTNLQTYKVGDITYKPIKLPYGNWDLQGFFQTEKFFLDIENNIRRQFTPASNITAYINEKYGWLLDEKSCSVHVRRGDFLQHSVAFPPQPYSFYLHAFKQFPKGTRFIVFSDDINWCKQHFKDLNFIFIENEKDIIDLFLMSRCTHHIISNSSFSWWGAWLNPNPKKNVFCPTWWFGPAVTNRPKIYARDIYARGFQPLSLPNEREWLIHIYYYFAHPFFKLYFQFQQIKSKILEIHYIRKVIDLMSSEK